MSTLTLSRPVTAPTRASWATQTAEVTHRWTVDSLRQPWGLGVAIIQPVIWLVLFGNVFSSVGSVPGFGGEDYMTFLVPGILMMTVLYSGAWAGTGFIDDINSGVMDRMLTSPVSRSSLVAGQLVQQLLICVVQGICVLGIGALAGAQYAGGVGGMALAIAASLLLAAAFCSLSAAVALLARDQTALIGISTIIVLPATFLSTTMMPADLMPEWVQDVSRWNPMTWAVELGRGGLSGEYPSNGWWQLGGLAVLAALAFIWAMRSIRAYQRSV